MQRYLYSCVNILLIISLFLLKWFKDINFEV